MIIDLIALLAIVYGLYTGYSKGLIQTVFDTLSIIIGIVAALKVSPIVINLLQGILPLSKSLVFIIGFVLTFLLIMGLIRFVGKKMESLLKVANVNVVNKILGAGLMALFFSLIVSYAVWGVNKLSLVNEDTLASSNAYPFLQTLPEKSQSLFESVKPVFSGFWEAMMDTMDSIKETGEDLTKPEEG